MREPLSDIELVKACLNNDRQAQEVLYRRYAAKMFHICLSYTADRNNAKDVLQESFIKVFKSIHEFNIEKSLEGWIRRIVTNTAIDYYRREKRLNYFDNIYDAAAANAAIPENQNIKLNTDNVLSHIKRLPEGARIVFNLFAVEGYSHKEIAGKLNITEGTSKSQFNRARTLLQEWLSATG